jgi:hypothetical protein
MKQKDIILLISALVVGVILSFVANNYLFSNAANSNTQVDVVPIIHTGFPMPSNKYFNHQAVDPTQTINISSNNSQPF